MPAKRTEEQTANAVKGCIMGGAAGDALGYATEFWVEDEIFSVYGEKGISAYELDPFSGKHLPFFLAGKASDCGKVSGK